MTYIDSGMWKTFSTGWVRVGGGVPNCGNFRFGFIHFGFFHLTSHIMDDWHERTAFHRSAFGRSTAGSDVVATILSFYSSPPPVFPPSRPFLIEGVLGSKNLFSESCLEQPKT